MVFRPVPAWAFLWASVEALGVGLDTQGDVLVLGMPASAGKGCNGACSAVLETCGCAQFSARVTADQSGAGCAIGRRGRQGYGSVNFLSWFAISSPRLIPQH